MVAVPSNPKCLIESGTCIWAVGAEFLPFFMLFVGFFYPPIDGPGDLWVVLVCADDGIEESSLESKFKLFYDSMFGKREIAKARKLFELSDIFIKAFSLLEVSQFSLCIFRCIGIGKGSAEICFKELPMSFVGVRSSSCNTVDELS